MRKIRITACDANTGEVLDTEVHEVLDTHRYLWVEAADQPGQMTMCDLDLGEKPFAGRLFEKEFPGFFDEDDLILICGIEELGFQDASWCQDSCPQFHRGNEVLYVDKRDPKQREVEEASRFLLVDFEHVIVETEYWSEVVRHIR